jgi:eukaryotic-like serine/threonine-protein kinase
MRPTSGLTFGGRYQLSNRVAIGGMGEVWQATDLVIGRTVAIKILKDEYLGDPGFLERFRAEARHAALVNHEGIANVFDYGEEDGSAYLVMELVPGEALSAIIERERQLPTDRVLDIVAQTANALQAAHAAGLVHRDIKPGNLLITPEGRVKITDFGIARIADQVPLTATGQVMGTVQYLSPEQASGHPASPATDIYSLGIVAYEALAGKRPFTGESQVAIAMAQINEQPPPLPATVAEPVRNLVMSCIAKNPADRPASAAHLARAAQALRRGDVAAAAAAVPGVLGAAGATTVLPVAANTAPTQATTLLPSAVPVATATAPVETEEERKRNPWTWWLVALIALLAVVLVGVLIALLTNPGEGGGGGTTSSAPPPSSAQPSSPTPTATPSANDRVTLNIDDITGRDQATVEAFLGELGLGFNPVTGRVADTPEQVGLAYAASPTGNVRTGEVITVQFFAEIPEPEATKPATGSVTEPAPYEVGDTVTFTWPVYNGCPADYPHSGFSISVQGATGTTSVGPSTTSTQIALDTAGDVTITYTALCTDFESPASDPTTITATE